MREDITIPNEYLIKRITVNLAPLYLAGYLEKQGLDVEVQIKNDLEELTQFRPEVLGISSVTENIEAAKELARKAKALWGPITILGGVHLTAIPKALPAEFDIGVVGEGEETLCEVLKLIDRYQGMPPEEELQKVSGIVFHSPKGVQQTPWRYGVSCLDEIPFPARHKYIQQNGITYMMTSRGCPYTCSFCTIPFTSKGYRTHSPGYVVEEMKSIRSHYPEVENIRIFDDLFIVDRKRVAKIADLVAAEGLSDDLSFGCWGRANLIDESMVRSFKKMNMDHVAFGAESGSSRVMAEIKPGATVEENQRAIDLLYDNGIRVACSVILGHPLETEQDLWDTYRFIDRNFDKLFEVEFNVGIPWPGTDLWRGAKSKGWVHEDMDFTPLKEAAFFPNYCTENYPYLNEKIASEDFDAMMGHFKKLFWKFVKRNGASFSTQKYIPRNEIARVY
jgi:magnesium-protoporphyrin IX monomethyl ester (oxidative) cyclase